MSCNVRFRSYAFQNFWINFWFIHQSMKTFFFHNKRKKMVVKLTRSESWVLRFELWSTETTGQSPGCWGAICNVPGLVLVSTNTGPRTGRMEAFQRRGCTLLAHMLSLAWRSVFWRDFCCLFDKIGQEIPTKIQFSTIPSEKLEKLPTQLTFLSGSEIVAASCKRASPLCDSRVPMCSSASHPAPWPLVCVCSASLLGRGGLGMRGLQGCVEWG